MRGHKHPTGGDYVPRTSVGLHIYRMSSLPGRNATSSGRSSLERCYREVGIASRADRHTTIFSLCRDLTEVLAFKAFAQSSLASVSRSMVPHMQ